MNLKPGTCSSCGCTNANPCLDEDGQPCGWANSDHTLCTQCAYDQDREVDELIERGML